MVVVAECVPAARRPLSRAAAWAGTDHLGRDPAGERTRYAGFGVATSTRTLTDEASKVGALPQTPPGAEPLDLNTCARCQ